MARIRTREWNWRDPDGTTTPGVMLQTRGYGRSYQFFIPADQAINVSNEIVDIIENIEKGN